MEKVRTQFGGLIKFFRAITLLTVYFATSVWIHLKTRDEVLRRKRFSENGCKYSGKMCRVLNIKTEIINKPPDNFVGLIVGNHMGFVDILVMCSMMPNLFITSQEMHQTPVLGLVTEFGGCVYVDRRSRNNIMKELEDVVEYLRIGFRVVLYPEATSHNGEELLPFKRTLLTAAAFAGVPILPYVFNFKSIDGQPFSRKNRDAVCYYGDIPFYTSLWSTLTLREIICTVEFLPEVFIKPDEDRAVNADRIRDMIARKFVPVKEATGN
jgi:lyso-ornithine lipid O-acyltransferase